MIGDGLRLVFTVAVVAASLGPSASAAPGGDRLQWVSCARQGAEYTATLDDSVLLDRAFLDERLSEDENIRAAVLQQLRYLWGYFRTRDKSPSAMQVVLAADEPEIRITRKSTVPYGRDLVIDWKETQPRLAVTDAYTVRAIARGRTRAVDDGLRVEYRARFRVAICGAARAARSTLQVQLPSDPWLLYWHVPAAQRRVMRYFAVTAVTTPCGDDDFADLPLPFYYWYDWQIDRHGRDDRGQGYDCRVLLKPGVDYFARTLELERTDDGPPDLTALRRALSSGSAPLTATVLLGVLDHAWPDLALLALRDELSGDGALSDRVARVLARPVERERATQKLLHLLADLPSLMAIASDAAALETGYLRVTVSGTLKRSGRAIRLRIYLGPTDIFGPTAPEHWQIARAALASDQVVVYAGHSGLGENLRLAQIERHLHLAHDALTVELERAPVQLVAFLSCYSYMYFGRDLMAAAARRPTRGRGFVYTGTEFSTGDRGALLILDLVDQVLAATETLVNRFVAPEDFLLWKGF